MASEIFLLVEKEVRVRDMNARYLERILDAGHDTYLTAEEAEAGRQSGDAYDDPRRTRVVGFRVEAFLPRKKKGNGDEHRRATVLRADPRHD